MSKRNTLILVLLLVTGAVTFMLLKGDSGAPENATVSDDANNEGATPRISPSDRSLRGVRPTRASGVVKSEQGEPIEGALVLLEPIEADASAEEDPITATSDEKGAWKCDAFDSGRYRISATAPGFLAANLPDVMVEAESDNPGLDISLQAGGNLFRGKISDVTGGDIEGAYVRVTPLGSRRGPGGGATTSARSDASGRFSMHLPTGRHRVQVQHLDYTPQKVAIQVAQGETERNFELTPMAVIEGVVIREADGKPVPGALVSVARERSFNLPGGQTTSTMEAAQRVVADDAGHFRIRGLQSGTIELRAAAENLASVDPTVVALNIAENRDGIVLRVGSARSVHGVTHVKGDPDSTVSGVEVQAMSRGAADFSARSDEKGQFVLHGLRDGPATLMVMAQGFLPSFPAARITVGEDTPEVVIELDPGLSIRGRVEPPVAATVRVDFDPGAMNMRGGMMMMGSSGGTRASPDGEFELAPVQPGTITLVAESEDGRAGKVEVEVGDMGAEGVIIALEERASFAGKVVDARGRAVPDATVSLTRKRESKRKMTLIINGQNMAASSTPSAEDGSFEVQGLEAGSYDVTVTTPGLGTLAWADPVDPKKPELPLVVEIAEREHRANEMLRVESRDGYIRGQVVHADGSAAADVWVTPSMQVGLDAPDDEEQGERSEMVMIMSSGDEGGTDPIGPLPSVLTDAEGKFAVEQLRPGKYTLVAEAPSGAGRVKRRDIQPDANLTLELAPLCGVRGSVEASGMKTEGARVAVSGPVNRSGSVKGGRYEIERLDPGRYQIEVSTSDGSQSASFTVEAGETATVDLTLQALVRVRGRVVDQEGEPIVNARLLITGGGAPPPGAGSPDEEQEEGTELSVSIGMGEQDEHVSDAEGRFDIATPAGMRVLIVMGSETPMPIAIVPVMVGDEDVDVGDVREGTMPQGAMMGGSGPGDPEGGVPEP
jgi:protocatechuate 3,4-dioxygenase beta subunit